MWKIWQKPQKVLFSILLWPKCISLIKKCQRKNHDINALKNTVNLMAKLQILRNFVINTGWEGRLATLTACALNGWRRARMLRRLTQLALLLLALNATLCLAEEETEEETEETTDEQQEPDNEPSQDWDNQNPDGTGIDYRV